MNITMGHDGSGRLIPPSFQARLDDFNQARRHRVHLVWNPKGRLVRGRFPAGFRFKPATYEPRWDIWIEWDESHHPQRERKQGQFSRKEDVRTIAPGVEAVKLCAYEWEGGSYADPFNENFFRALEWSDAWRRGFDLSGPDAQVLEGEEVYRVKEARLHEKTSQIAIGTTNYYRSLDSPIVAPYGSKSVRAGWRHRLIHR